MSQFVLVGACVLTYQVPFQQQDQTLRQRLNQILPSWSGLGQGMQWLCVFEDLVSNVFADGQFVLPGLRSAGSEGRRHCARCQVQRTECRIGLARKLNGQ